MFNREIIAALAQDCDKPIGDEYLDRLHDTYNEGSVRQDDPHYYRFIYNLARDYNGAHFVELGTHYGACAYHFWAGSTHYPYLFLSKTPRIRTVDIADRVKENIRFVTNPEIEFHFGSSLDVHTRFEENCC